MVKVVYMGNRRPNVKKKPASVTSNRVVGQDGKTMTVRTVNADSRTLGDDLTYVFRRNVQKARRENKRIVGSTDYVPAKG